MLVVPLGSGVGLSVDPLRHLVFRDLVTLFRPGDLLVVNDSRVIPARLLGKKLQKQNGRFQTRSGNMLRAVEMEGFQDV